MQMITGIASTTRIVIIQNGFDAMKIIVSPSKSTNSTVRSFRIYKILNLFLVRITKDLGCYDQLAFKFIKQAKSVFNKTSEDYDKWISGTYVPINLCGTPSTEAGFQFNAS